MTERISTDGEQDLRYIDENYKYIKERIGEAALKSGRAPSDVRFMAVTKTVPAYIVNRAIACGADLIGENKVQELLEKRGGLHTDGLEMHIIGHLQSNKVKKIVGVVRMVQSVDSLSLAQEISKRAQESGLVMDVLTEVNIGCEWSKTGFAYEELIERSLEIDALPGVNVRGLMAIPPVCETEDEARGYFAKMRRLFEDAKPQFGKPDFDVLSLGMSGDYEAAILEGSTLVRVGSALFGQRRY